MIAFAIKTAFAALLTIGTLAGSATIAAADSRPQMSAGIELAQAEYLTRRPERRGCSPRLAEEVARDYGMRRTRVVDVTPRRVVVEGRIRGGWDRIVFANVRGCPLLRR